MRQVKPDGPRIYGDQLYRTRAAPLPVGGSEWAAWLDTADTFYFRDASRQEWHRARRERRRGGAYWYVACRVGGQVRRFYLGPPAAIDSARLAAVADAIATARGVIPRSEPDLPAPPIPV